MNKQHTNKSENRSNAKDNFLAFLTDVAKALGKEAPAHVDLRPAAKARQAKAEQVVTQPTSPRSPELQAYLDKINKPEWHPELHDTPEDRIKAAKAFASKLLSYGYATRKSLLKYLKELEKQYSGFPLKAILSFGFKKPSQLHGAVGARVAELHKAQKPLINELVKFSVFELRTMIEGVSLKNLRTKYNTDLRPHEVEELSGPVTLKVERDIELTRRQIAAWKRTKVNEDNRKFRRKAKRIIKAKAVRPNGVVTQKLKAYARQIQHIGKYIADGWEVRRGWINEIEQRTKTTQTMNNLD